MTTTSEIIDKTATAKVCWDTQGTYGAKGFSGTLSWMPIHDGPMATLGFQDPEAPIIGYRPLLTIADGNEGWSGLTVRDNRQEVAGRLDDDTYYTGTMRTGTDAKTLRDHGVKVVFAGTVSYLHALDKNALCTDAQRQLVIEAICIRKQSTEANPCALYSAGATLQTWAHVSRDDYERDATNAAAYNR